MKRYSNRNRTSYMKYSTDKYVYIEKNIYENNQIMLHYGFDLLVNEYKFQIFYKSYINKPLFSTKIVKPAV